MTLRLEGVSKLHKGGGGVVRLDLDVAAGETVALVGPSGCGKTTALRVAAGFATPDSGRVLVGGRDVTALPAERRGIGMVFQSYALFPHLSVGGNVEYGLRARRVPASERARRTEEALALVGLAGRRDARIDALSGGEQQRVAVARAVAAGPSVLLLDEPLSNLDLALRRRTRASLREIHRRVGAAAVHVTHDQEEALSIGDRVAVMRAGRVEQIGPPDEVFHRPRTAFTARFLGGANVVPAEVLSADGATAKARAFDGRVFDVPRDATLAAAGAAVLVVRPEAVRVASAGAAGALPAEVVERGFAGADVELTVVAAGTRLGVRMRSDDPGADAAPGALLHLVLPPEKLRLLPPDPEGA